MSKIQMKSKSKHTFNIKEFFLQWEWVLVGLLILITIINSSISEYYLDFKLLVSATSTFLDKSFIVLPMAFVMILGEIDISVASILALSSVIMGVVFSFGIPMVVAIIICLLIASLCGLINGLLIAKFPELSSVIITLSTMIIFRGIAYVILEDQAIGSFPTWFSTIGWGQLGFIPYILFIFLLFALMFYFVLHKTSFGRKIYAIGSNKTASYYSGVRVKRIKIIIFTLTGLMAGVAALVLTSRLGSTRPNIAVAYELDVIAIVVLGGVSSAGGKGKMLGVIMAIFLIGYLRYGLGLVNISSQILLIIVGGLLVVAVMAPNIIQKLRSRTQ